LIKSLFKIFYAIPESDISQVKAFFGLHDALASRRPPKHFSLQNLIFLELTKRS